MKEAAEKTLKNKDHPRMEMAEKVRQACIEAAREGFIDASISGLCNEGAMEAAIGAIESLKLDKLIATSATGED